MSIALITFALGAATLCGGGASFWLNRRLRQEKTRNQGQLAACQLLEAQIKTLPWARITLNPDMGLSLSREACALTSLPATTHIDEFLGFFTVGEEAALREALRHLNEQDQAIDTTVQTRKGGRSFHLLGGHHSQARVLWIQDVTTTTKEQARLKESVTSAEQALQEWQALATHLPMPLWLRDDHLNLLWCNAAYAALVESTPDAVIKQQRELSFGLNMDDKKALAKRAKAAKAPATENGRIVVKGARRFVGITETPLPGLGRQIGMALDKTTENDVGAELQRHLSAQGDLLEQLGSPIAIYGADTRLKFYNQAYRRTWGLDETWLDTHPTFGDILENLRERRRLPEVVDFQRFKKERLALFTSLIEPQESLQHLPDGTTLRTLVAPHALGGLVFVLEDVTSKLALETSYNTLMAVQKETLNNLAEGMAVFGSDGRLKLFNPAFGDAWGLKPEDLQDEPHLVELLNRIKHHFIDPANGNTWPEKLLQQTLDRTTTRQRIERTDGSVVLFTTVPLPDGAVLTTTLDVTDTVRVEQALRASNTALESADRLKTAFIANVTQQLRTPLNAIMGFAEVLEHQYFGPLNDRQHEYSRSILDASQRLLSLINDILDVANVEAGYLQLEKTSAPVKPLLLAVVELTQEWTKKQNLAVNIDCPDSVGSIPADEKRLKQIVFNLVGNAIKFTPAGGIITLTARRHKQDVAITIADNGIGIPESDIVRVFGTFERSGNAGSYGGTGLGLSLVKSLVELHGGNVTLDSKPNDGTTVTCLFPVENGASDGT